LGSFAAWVHIVAIENTGGDSIFIFYAHLYGDWIFSDCGNSFGDWVSFAALLGKALESLSA